MWALPEYAAPLARIALLLSAINKVAVEDVCKPDGMEVTNTTGRLHFGFGASATPRPPICIWKIRPSSGQGLYFTFEYLQLGRTSDCRLGNVTVVDWGHYTAHRYCGGSEQVAVGNPFYIPSVKVDVISRSSPETPNMGFILHFQAVACPALAIPHGVGVQLDGNRVTVVCGGAHADEYHCRDAEWQPPPPEPLCPSMGTHFPLLGLIAIGVCALVIIVGIIVVAACLNRRWQQRLRLASMKNYSQQEDRADVQCPGATDEQVTGHGAVVPPTGRGAERAGATVGTLEDRQPLLNTEDYVTLQMSNRHPRMTECNDYSLPPTRMPQNQRTRENDYTAISIKGRSGLDPRPGTSQSGQRRTLDRDQPRVQFSDDSTDVENGRGKSRYASAAMLVEESFLYDSDDDCTALCPCWNTHAYTDDHYRVRSHTKVHVGEEPRVRFTKGQPNGLDNPASSSEDSMCDRPQVECPPIPALPAVTTRSSPAVARKLRNPRTAEPAIEPVLTKPHTPKSIQRVHPFPLSSTTPDGKLLLGTFSPKPAINTHRRTKTIGDYSRRLPEYELDNVAIRKPTCHNRHSAENIIDSNHISNHHFESSPPVVDTLRGTKRKSKSQKRGKESLAKESIYKVGGPHVPIRPPPRDPRQPRTSPTQDPCQQYATNQAVYANLPLNTQITSSLYSQVLSKPERHRKERAPSPEDHKAGDKPMFASPCRPKKNRRPKKVAPPVAPKPGSRRPTSLVSKPSSEPVNPPPGVGRAQTNGYALAGQSPAELPLPNPVDLDVLAECSPEDCHCPVEDYLVPGETPSPTQYAHAPPSDVHTITADVHFPHRTDHWTPMEAPAINKAGIERQPTDLSSDLLVEPHMAQHLGIGWSDPTRIMCRSCPDITQTKIYL